MTEQKHIIWSSDPDYEDWRGDLEEQYPELSEQERMELMVEQNNDYLDDERCNLNIQLSRPILLIADIGRWDGRYPGYAEIKSGNIWTAPIPCLALGKPCKRQRPRPFPNGRQQNRRYRSRNRP